MKFQDTLTLVTMLTLVCGVSGAVEAQTTKPQKTPLPPISIELGDNPAARSKPAVSQTPASSDGDSTPEGSIPGPEATEAEKKNFNDVVSILKESDVSLSNESVLNKVAGILAGRIASMNVPITNWRTAALQVDEVKGLTPDFATEQDLDDRIKLHQSLKRKTTLVVAGMITNFRNLEKDLIKVGIPEPDAKAVNIVISGRFKGLIERMTFADKMADTGLKALGILKKEWGHFSYNGNTGLQFEDKFSDENKQNYLSLIGEYKDLFDKLKETGAFEQ